MGHLKFVISIQLKVIVFFENSFKIQNNFWSIKNLVEAFDEGKKNIFSPEDIKSLQTNFQ